MRNGAIRPRWYSGASVPGLVGIVFFTVFAFVGESRGFLGVAAVMAVGWIISMFGTTIEVTATDIGVRLWFLGRRAAPRDVIRAMHWFSAAFTFVDGNRSVILRVASYGWTRSQLLDLSEALGVPLYSHRTKRGWGKNVRIGHIVTRAGKAK